MKERRIYISGAISGTNDYMERFADAEKELENFWSVINPARINSNMPDDTQYEEYMKLSTCLLDMCDAIYMLNGWQQSCGANREYGYALAKGLKIIKE